MTETAESIALIEGVTTYDPVPIAAHVDAVPPIIAAVALATTMINVAALVRGDRRAREADTARNARRIAGMRAIAATLVSADVDATLGGEYHTNQMIAELMDHVEAVIDVVPIGGIAVWIWCHERLSDGSRHDAIAAYASGTPLGLDDPVVATWATRMAARHPHAPWAMRLLGAMGEAA